LIFTLSHLLKINSKAKQFHRFVTGKGDSLANMDLVKQIEFIKYLDINENDLSIMKFWTGCLKPT
jgi:hypothetical protein